ncbi:MAG TPA: hypothetical protein VGP61_02695 [Gemmatimonadales bacterium]|nr:hypothetical protein [Gemmatimonadales bacterium]
MKQPDTTDLTERPRHGWLLAVLLFVAAALVLCYPMLSGQFIAGPGSDQYVAGYAFRNFAAEYWRSHHAIPLWNPYIFGGLPYVGAMHGDVFYPTAWLRWFLPTGTAMNLGFALHLVLAGVGMFALLRGLRLSWTAAVAGGLAYELSGIVASLVYPGHDGKLFVSALAPFLLLALLRAIRHRSLSAFGAAGLVIGLALHGHPQMSYYLLIAAGLWTLFLVFWDPEGPRGPARWRALGWSVLAVGLGFGLYAVQALPFAAYIPYSPRAAGGPSGGWEYATGYAFPPAELWSLVYPQINGITATYSGTNCLKHHTEHLGAVVILLALCGLGGGGRGQERHRERVALGAIAALFLLVAFGGHTPFYRAWYELVPKMKQVRAAGMAFYLVALVGCVFAGLGAERLLAGKVPARRILIGGAVFAVLGLLGAIGALDGIAQSLAAPELMQRAVQNAGEIRAGGIRLLLAASLGAGVLYAIRAGRLPGRQATLALLLVIGGDLWSIDREFFFFGGSPAQLFGNDSLTLAMRKSPLPYRVWDPKGVYEQLGAYPGSWLMGVDVPQLLGYHGNELRAFDDLLGEKNAWKNQPSPALLQLFAVRYVLLTQAQTLPGYHQILGPTATTVGSAALLYEADTIPPYLRLMAGALKAPAEQIAGTVVLPRFPALQVALYPEGEQVSPGDLGGRLPEPPRAVARLAAWDAGKMRVAIEGSDPRPLYLVIGENWYKDWTATVDGAAAPVLRAQNTLLSVVVPPGAKEISLEFRSKEYQRGKLISLLALLALAALIIIPQLRARGRSNV